MDALLTLIVGWPTGVYTVLLGVVVLYWLMALVGVVNFDHGHLHIDAHHEVPNHSGGEHLSTIAGYVVAFGLSGVPFSIVISLVTLIAWVITGLISQYLLSWVPTAPLRAVAGLAVAVLALAPSIFLTALLVQPIRGLFVRHTARSSQGLIGLYCRVTTLTVGEAFGQAEGADHTGSFNIRIAAEIGRASCRERV